MIYNLREIKKIVSKDVQFEEDFTSKKSHDPLPDTEDEELEALGWDKVTNEFQIGEATFICGGGSTSSY